MPDTQTSHPNGIALHPTGITELDEMLNGGIPKGATVLVAGQSGAGKTMLCTEWLCAGMRDADEAGLYITLTESETKLIKHLRGTTYFKDEYVTARGMRFHDLRGLLSDYDKEGRQLTNEDVWKIVEAIAEVVTENNAKRVIIDSVTALCYRMGKQDLIRNFIFALGTTLAYLDATVFLISEVGGKEYSIFGVEEFISDGIIKLSYQNEGLRTRQLQLVKMRGVDFNSYPAKFNLTEDGIKLFPYTHDKLEYGVSSQRIPSGIDGMDALLNGGYIEGSTVLISGPSGAGKSTMAQQCTQAQLLAGKKTLYMTFEESKPEMFRNGIGFGWQFEKAVEAGLLDVIAKSPAEDYLEAHFEKARKKIEEDDVKFVVVDSLSALQNTFDIRHVLPIIKRFIASNKSNGVTTVFTTATNSLVGSDNATGMELSTLTDTIVMLRYIEIDSELHHGVMIIKMRSSEHDRRMHEMKFGKDGVRITSTFSGYEGVMSGTAHKVDQSTEEQLFSVFLEVLGDKGGEVFEEERSKGITKQGLNEAITKLAGDGEISEADAGALIEKVNDIVKS